MAIGKGVVACVVAGAVVCGMSARAASDYRATDDFAAACVNKILRGGTNVVTGWIEIFNQATKKTRSSGPAQGLTVGVLKGLWYGVGRTLHGAAELVTFPLANHQSNEDVGVPLDAEFAWEEGTPAREYGGPIGNKVVRGVVDLSTGWIEVGAQPVLVSRAKGSVYGWTAGLVKGLWFGASRLASGAVEAAMFVFPNPVDTAGYPFASLRAWDPFKARPAAAAQE